MAITKHDIVQVEFDTNINNKIPNGEAAEEDIQFTVKDLPSNIFNFDLANTLRSTFTMYYSMYFKI